LFKEGGKSLGGFCGAYFKVFDVFNTMLDSKFHEDKSKNTDYDWFTLPPTGNPDLWGWQTQFKHL
jgi:hypothetical protein